MDKDNSKNCQFVIQNKNKNTKVLIIYSVIFTVISIISVTLRAEYAMDDLDMVIFVIIDSEAIRINVLFSNLQFWLLSLSIMAFKKNNEKPLKLIYLQILKQNVDSDCF